jgi:hypothetical protein
LGGRRFYFKIFNIRVQKSKKIFEQFGSVTNQVAPEPFFPPRDSSWEISPMQNLLEAVWLAANRRRESLNNDATSSW